MASELAGKAASWRSRSPRSSVSVVDSVLLGVDWRIALCMFSFALFVRAVAAFFLADVALGVEIWEYGQQGLCAYETGGNLCMRDRTGAAYASAYMPPLTSYVWLGLFQLFGDSSIARMAYVALNVLAGALGPGLLYLFARKSGLEGISAIVGALLLSTYPTFVFVSTSYHATNFTIVLLLGFALALLQALRSGTILPALVTGVLCGLGALTRTEMVLVGAGAGLLLLWRHRKHWRAAILPVMAFGLGAVLIVGPWTARNYVVFERVIVVANASGYNLWKAFGPYTQGSAHQAATEQEGVAALEAIRDAVPLGDAAGARYESRVQDAFAADTAQFMAKRDAAHLIALTAQKIAVLWLLDWSDSITHHFLYWAPWFVVNVLVVVGAYQLMRGRFERLDADGAATIFLLLGALTLSYAISGVHARYRMHLEPMLFLFAGVALGSLLSSVRQAVFDGKHRK